MKTKHALGGGRRRSVGKQRDPENDVMRLSYGQVTRLLTSILSVDSGKAVALSGRLKHFQRARFPGGTNTGLGLRATYRLDQLFALVFAFRLLALRFPPRDAAAAVEANRSTIRKMLLTAWQQRSDQSYASETDPGPLLAGIFPDGLEDLRRGDFEDGPADVVSPLPQRKVWSWMRGVDKLPTPGLVLLDVGALLDQTVICLEELGLANATDISEGFKEIAQQIDDAEREGAPVT
jgi:hypothetical protein